jgi:putative transposase
LKALFGGAMSKDTVSRVWRKVKADWNAWNARSLADEPVVRLILDGTVVDVRLNHKATASLLVVLGVRMVRRCCSRSRPWAGRAATSGAASSTDLIGRGLAAPTFGIAAPQPDDARQRPHRGAKPRRPRPSSGGTVAR